MLLTMESVSVTKNHGKQVLHVDNYVRNIEKGNKGLEVRGDHLSIAFLVPALGRLNCTMYTTI